MAVLGAGSGTGFPGVVDTAQTYANISTPDPDDNTRVDAAFANDIMAALLALETSIPKFIVAGPTATRTYTFPDVNGSVPLLAVANVFTATPTFSNATYSALFTGGNVGIGTTGPLGTLDIYRTNDGGKSLTLTYPGGIGYDFVRSNSTGALEIQGTQTGANNIVLAPTSGNVGIGTTSPTYQLQLSTDSAAKPTTNTWTIASDANMKDASKQRPYERGLDLIRVLPTPHYWTYNGKADTPEGVESMGWNAQDLEVIAPKMVRKTRGKLTPAREKRMNEKGEVELVPVPKEIVDALPETDLLGINTHELTYAMFNAVRELDARVKALEKKP